MNEHQLKNLLVGITVSLFTLAGTAMFFEWQKDRILGFSVASYNSTIAQSISASTSSIRVAGIKDRGGNDLDIATLGGKIFLTLEPGTSKEEFTVCTGRTGTTFTGCTRGLPFSGSTNNSETASSTLQFSHNSGSIVIASNQPAVYEQLLDKDTDQRLTGSIIIATSSLFIGDGSNTGNKILYANNASATSTKPRIFFNVTNSLWEVSNDGASTFSISPTSTIISAGKNLNITSSVVGTNDTIYVPTIYATTTQITGALSASGTVIFGYMGSSTSPNSNNTLDLGYYGGAWRDIFASGTLYAGSLTLSSNLSSSSTLQADSIITYATSTMGLYAYNHGATGTVLGPFDLNVNIPGGLLQPNSSIRVSVFASSTRNVDGANVTAAVRFGGTTFGSFTFLAGCKASAPASSCTNSQEGDSSMNWKLITTISNRNSLSSQVADSNILRANEQARTTSTISTYPTLGTVNTAVTQTLNLQITSDSYTNNMTLGIEDFLVEILK